MLPCGSVPPIRVFRETRALHPHNAEALPSRRLHHDPTLQAVYDSGTEPLEAGHLGRYVIGLDIYVDATLVAHALNLHDGLIRWGLEHAVIAAGTRVIGVDRTTECLCPELSCVVHIGAITVDEQGAETRLMHIRIFPLPRGKGRHMLRQPEHGPDVKSTTQG